MGNIVVTEFVDSVGTSEVTYTFQEPQESLRLYNNGSNEILISVGSQVNVSVPAYQSVTLKESFTSFNIKSSSGYGSFKATASYEIQDEEDERILGEKVNALTSQLAENATRVNISKSERPLFFAHRGMENLAPENTIIALEYAGQLGADGVEFDIQDTADGVWVLMHDDTVDRTTDGTGTIGSKTLTQVKSLNVDYGPYITRYTGTKVPTLEEALRLCKKWGMKAIVEIKKVNNPNNNVRIIDLINQLGMLDSVKLLAPVTTAIELKAIEPKIEYGCLLNSFAELNNATPLLPYAHVALEKTTITKDGVSSAHAQGFKVSAWTLNYDDGDLVQTLRSYGVDYITGTVLS